MSVVGRVKVFLEVVKFQHTLFAMPFAIMSAFLAARGWPSLHHAIWILLAVISARNAAMAFNRLCDHEYDALNPRTKDRSLPRGLISRREVWIFLACNVALFIVCAWRLNWLALALSPVALVIILGYSYTKRFTVLSHFVLGMALMIAPIGAWVAIAGSLDWPPIILGLAVLLWTAGFDLIYACQDYQSDVEVGLRSFAARYGVRATLILSAALHVAMIAVLVSLYWVGGLGIPYLCGVCVVGGLLVYEHLLVKPDDLSRINAAFFTVNGLISIGLMVAFVADIMMQRS